MRPDSLLAAREQARAGNLPAEELRALEDDAILTSLARQETTGIDVYVDGEFRRSGFLTGFPDSVEGFVDAPAEGFEWKGGTGNEGASPNLQTVVGSKLRQVNRIAGAEAAFLEEHAPGPFKITLPSPVNFALIGWRRETAPAEYATPSAFMADAAQILADEARLLEQDGVGYLQLDAPVYTHWGDPSLGERYRERGFDMETLLGDAIEADNAILDAVGDGVVTGVHLCRGNSMGRWLAEGGYDALAERFFNGMRCDRLLLEYDSPRAGTFEPLRFVPDDKVVVLGLVTNKSGDLESRDELLRRIEEASAFVPVERLALSPQCGFASSGHSSPLTEDRQWAKLELIASVAQEVWSDR
jgi:5-methyltetrahydropteroyltriglutamate--homocysteine methyltransferase